MTPFDFQFRTRFVFGAGQLSRLGELAGELAARRAIVFSDPGIVAAGHAARGVQLLEQAGIDVALFSQIEPNPTTADVEAGVALAKQFKPELFVGLGGGSSMDCAKGVNFVFSCGGKMQDYWGVGKAPYPLHPLIAVPTTAGTGSEAQSYALISDAQTHAKMACGDKKAAARVALLDPELTVTQPQRVTALTGIDALAHALETFVTRTRNPFSLTFSREAWRRLARNFPRVLAQPDDLYARGEMLLGASLAGLAIESSMLGAAHALANPLTAAYDVVHGEAIALVLPHVIRFNAEEFGELYWELLQDLGEPWLERGRGGPAAAGAALADWVEDCRRLAGLNDNLQAVGVQRDKLPELAASAAEQWTARHNPRTVDEDRLRSLYDAAYRND